MLKQKKEMAKIQTHIPVDVHALIIKRAEDEDRSVSGMIRILLERGLKNAK